MIDTESEEYEGMTLFDGCDKAIIGTVVNENGSDVFVYSYDKLVEIFTEEFGEEGAMDWVDFNLVGFKAVDMPLIMSVI